MKWSLDFISEEDFIKHVTKTIEKYGEKLESFNLEKFNSNTIDPVKLVFDKTVYHYSWEQIVNNEISRQRDKSNNNDIGYFHQRIFQYIDHCHVPTNGWDIIYENNNGIKLPEGDIVHKVYVEMKNKHNTMNSSASGKTYIRMQDQLLKDDDCACFLVEAIAHRSQDIRWETTVDKKKVSHGKIRRVSIDKFYSLVTGEDDAFYQMCMTLPSVIELVVSKGEGVKVPHDTVLEELMNVSKLANATDELSMVMAAYLLGFSTYMGFDECINKKFSSDRSLKYLYEYAKKQNDD